MYLTDHPRRCGENVTKFGMLTSLIGSPPQVRGKQEKMKILLTLLRITPAGAGKTNKMIFDELEVWDHPRRCGENAQALNDLDADKGSPPQVRGKQSFAVLPPLRTRITPAGAGKTEFAPLSVHVTEDHPRRCGENLCISLQIPTVAGSPPQVRGKLPPGGMLLCPSRITPAGAGKTAMFPTADSGE